MDASGQPPDSRQRFVSYASRAPRWLAALVGCLLLLAVFALQLSVLSGSGTVYGAAKTHTDVTPQPSPTSTQAAVPPTLSLAVPTSAQGPVGAQITIVGSNWGSSDVSVGAANPGATCADPNSWVQTFSRVRPQADQSIVFAFTWPTGLSSTSGAYSICAANDAGVADVSYQVLSTSPPSLTLDPTTVPAGALVKVTGANFVGSGEITLTVTDAHGKTRELTTLPPDATGGFTLQFQPRPTDVGDEVLHAFSGGAPHGMRPALQADAKLHVGAAPTPTLAPSPTVAIVVTPAPNQGGGKSDLLIVVLIVGFLLALLAIGGAVAYFIMRNRRNQADGEYGKSGYAGGSSPEYGQPGNIYSDMNRGIGYGTAYGRGLGGMDTGGWDAPTVGGYPAGQGGWPEPDEPDASWRPRPMTGQWHEPEGYSDASHGSYGSQGDFGNYGAGESGRYPPSDPWANRDDPYGSAGGHSGRPYGSGQNYGSGQRSGNRGSYPPPGQGGRPPSGPRNRGSGSSGGGGRRGSSGGPPQYPRERYPEPPPDDTW